MRNILILFALAGAAIDAPVAADPWKDESGKGWNDDRRERDWDRGERGRGEPPWWERGRGYWDGRFKDNGRWDGSDNWRRDRYYERDYRWNRQYDRADPRRDREWRHDRWWNDGQRYRHTYGGPRYDNRYPRGDIHIDVWW